MSTKQYSLTIFIIVIGILASFYSGYFLKDLLKKEANSIYVNEGGEIFKPTFIDEVVLISKQKPHQTLKLSAFRKFEEKDVYNYILKAQYFDGSEWTFEKSSGNSKELYTIPKTNFLPIWTINSDPSYMLKQSAIGEAKIKNIEIKFDIPNFYNEMVVRTSPKYTKFMSETNGTLTINNIKYESKVLYSRVYSFNPPESLVYTNDPAGIETEWLAFWDESGNFYSIDETVVDNKITLGSYKAHSMAIEKDKNGKVQYSFDLKLKKDENKNYKVDIGNNINKSLSIKKINSVHNDIYDGTEWFVGLTEGITLKGYGFYEQITQNNGL